MISMILGDVRRHLVRYRLDEENVFSLMRKGVGYGASDWIDIVIRYTTELNDKRRQILEAAKLVLEVEGEPITYRSVPGDLYRVTFKRADLEAV